MSKKNYQINFIKKNKFDKILLIIKSKLPEKIINRKTKISIDTKLKGILYVLRTGISWVDLGIINKIDESNYRNFFYKLNKLKIFDNIMNSIKNDSNITFIDSSVIVNKCGKKESVGYCPQNKKHKGNKISLIVNDKGKPLGCKIDKSSCHDFNR